MNQSFASRVLVTGMSASKKTSLVEDDRANFIGETIRDNVKKDRMLTVIGEDNEELLDNTVSNKDSSERATLK